MKKLSCLAHLAALVEKNKRIRYALVASAALLAALIFLASGTDACTGKNSSQTTETAPTATAGTDHAAELESRLEGILSGMAGVGGVRVMLTLDRTEEQVIAMNDRSAGNDKNASTESRPATVSGGGREEPIVLTEVLPRIRGVIVLAEGAGNIAVKYNIVAAVSTVLGIDEKCVEVFVMAA